MSIAKPFAWVGERSSNRIMKELEMIDNEGIVGSVALNESVRLVRQ
jgi:hypothetical protein